MSTVEDQGGAQILPDVRDQRATVSSYAAHLATNADLRRVAPTYYNLASQLIVRRG